MCENCGCGSDEFKIVLPGDHKHDHDHEHPHSHGHGHGHSHDHTHEHEKEISVQQDILHHNQMTAERNRGYFEAKKILAINLISSPGSGKTSLLEKTITGLKNKKSIAVIEGDQQTTRDADRIISKGVKAIQINTGNGCHLDAGMVNEAVKKLEVTDNSILFIENVGNLVCPSLFDLGEAHRVVMISVTEGEDKPLKYPYIFASSQFCIINKTDLLPYLDFNIELLKKNALQINPKIKFFEISVKTGEGLNAWIAWLTDQVK
jgi:hydrogenase nickel incorporation protein HypB